VLLFGPTPPATWGPPTRPYHRVLWNGATGDPHADRVDPGLAAIPVERVIAALATLPA
jgi:ADP-heptose:LPS heptosyltransferase